MTDRRFFLTRTKKGLLKDTQYYVKEDYPIQVLKKRREVQEQIKMEKEKDNKVRTKYDKLVILKTTNKRSLLISPENIAITFKKQNQHTKQFRHISPQKVPNKEIKHEDTKVRQHF